MKSRNFILAVLLCALLMTPTLYGQVDYSTATLRGTVMDPNGAVIAGATVTATNSSTGISRVVKTSSDGAYRFSALPPGSYQLSTVATGFSKESFKGLELTVGQSVTYDVHLKVGVANEVVEVSADNLPLIQADQSQQANTINSLQVQELPNLNRSFTNDVYTLPGVSNSDSTRAQNPGFTGYLTTGFSIGGSNGRNNLSTIDGGENEYGTGQYRVTNLPVDAIQEYQVNRNAFAAEFGFTDGSAINIVTKSGGQKWHGDLFGYFRNRSTSASNFFNTESFNPGSSNAFSQNVYMGGSLGGPLVGDKLFFFTAYEFQRLDTPFFNPIINTSEVQGINTPGLGQNCGGPTGQLASGSPDQVCYLNALKGSGDPFLVGFANGITPGLAPLNDPQLAKIINRDNGVFNAPDRLHNVIARFDYLKSDRDSFTLRVGYAHNNFHSGIAGITNATPDGSGLFVRDFSILGTWTRNVNQNVVNQMLVQVVPRNRSSALPNNDNGINFSLGNLGEPGLGGTSTFGEPSLIPYKAHQQRYQFEDDITWIRGKHSIKFGASYRPANYTIEDDLWFNNEFDFKDGLLGLIILAPPAVQGHLVAFNDANHFGTPNCNTPINPNPCLGPASTNLSAAQSFAFGLPVDVVAGFNNPTWHGWGHYFGSYIQDSWKVSPRLTINGGVRLDLDGEPSPLGASFYASPRLGFAWDPFGSHKTILRAGAGIYVATIDVLIPSYGSLLDGSGRYINEVLNILSATNPAPAQLWGLGLATGKLPFGHLSPADFAAVGIDTTTPGASVGYSVASNYRNPYSVQMSMSIDQQIARNLSLELGYNMYHAVHLQMPVETGYARIAPGSPFCPPVATDPNCTDSTGGPLYAPTGSQFQHTTYASNGSSIYHGLTASLTKRLSHGVQFQANYTWSKTIDDTIDFASFQNWFRPDMISSFRAVSVFDIPHIFTANAVYTTPFKPGHGALSAILGDISISPIITVRSGLPFSVRMPNTTNKVNGQTLDSNYAMPFLSSRDNNRGARYASWDMNFQKSVYINRDRNVRLNLIAQAINLLNHTNFNHVNDVFDLGAISATGTVKTAQGPLNLVTGPFTGLHGHVPTSASDLNQPLFYSSADVPRQVQFGLRLAF